MATLADIQAWSIGIGLPEYVGAEFAGEHGGRLPSSLSELIDWGNVTGRRNQATGGWSSRPVQVQQQPVATQPVQQQPAQQPASQPAPSASGATPAAKPASSSEKWLYVVGGVALFLLLKR